ncbi:MAG: dimethylarginine dimethylaminohydrolase [Microbacteriaceae bacterium]|nr:dimethylarginine dimethylaminohydrolase [Cryobacterium sp.]MCC6376077.1 dimethylarginine dimethylaminohydrolase [Microbacteriaceae bacterium]
MNSGHLAWLRRIVDAIVSALIIAATTHLGAMLLFFMTNNANGAVFPQVSEFFLPASLLLFVLLAIVIGFDGFRRWYAAVPAVILVVLLSALFGALVLYMNLSSGARVDPLTFISSFLLGPWLVFMVLAVLVGVFLGRKVWSAISGVKLDSPQSRTSRIALVRLPAANLAEGQVTHIARSVIDTEKADEQWDGYVAALVDNGWEVVEVPVATASPDSVFVEDTVVMFGDTAVITSPGHESRRSEPEAVELTVRELGLNVERINLPATLDGGDVLKVGTTVYVGRSDRTNGEGIRQLRAIVSRLGYQVVPVPVSKVLHLKSAVTALPDGTVIGYPKLVDNPELFGRFLAVPEETGVAVVILDDETLLISASAPKTTKLLSDLGYRMIPVEISEFEKLEGCVTCLSVRIR